MAPSTAPFHTLDPVSGQVVETVLRSLERPDDGKAWSTVLEAEPRSIERLGMEPSPSCRSDVGLDDATLLFLLALRRKEDGDRLTVAEGRHVERFGRFPEAQGCLLTYVLNWMRPTRGHEADFERLANLLARLAKGLDDEHPQATEGASGLRLHGWLASDDVSDLRVLLMGRCWTVAADEPLDGGMRDAVNHLTAMLRGAERRGVGLLHRSHA